MSDLNEDSWVAGGRFGRCRWVSASASADDGIAAARGNGSWCVALPPGSATSSCGVGTGRAVGAWPALVGGRRSWALATVCCPAQQSVARAANGIDPSRRVTRFPGHGAGPDGEPAAICRDGLPTREQIPALLGRGARAGNGRSGVSSWKQGRVLLHACRRQLAWRATRLNFRSRRNYGKRTQFHQ